MRPFSCLIVQKVSVKAKLLSNKLKQYFSLFDKITTTSSGSKAFNYLLNIVPNLIFLDIKLFKENKKDWTAIINHQHSELILLCSALSVDKSNSSQFFFLNQPFSDHSLIQVVNNCLQRQFSKSVVQNDLAIKEISPKIVKAKKIAIPTKEGYVLKKVEEIVRIESQNRYSVIYFRDNTNYVRSYNLGKYKEMLSGSAFIQSHKSHIVNGEHISEYRGVSYNPDLGGSCGTDFVGICQNTPINITWYTNGTGTGGVKVLLN